MSTSIHIFLNPRRLELRKDQTPIRDYPVAIGKTSTPTPVGNFSVLLMRKNPGGALGTRWIQFTWRAHGIHGTNQPHSIGQAVSLGCVRMFNHDVEHLYNYVSIGTPIEISQGQPVETIPNPPSQKEGFYHTIKAGDTLWLLSQKYSVSLVSIKKANPHLRPHHLFIGEKVKIPPR